MKELSGKGVSNGIAIGTLYYYNNSMKDIPEYRVQDCRQELERYRSCLQLAKDRLWSIYHNACKRVTKSESVIFRTHIMILEDSKFIELVESNINQGNNAEFSVFQAATTLSNLFKNLDDDYFKARCTDIIDAAHILLEVLQNKNQLSQIKSSSGQPVIVAASELLPSDTLSFQSNDLLGFVTNEGSQNSHTAILARTMGIPSIIQVDHPLSEYNGMTAIIDGQLGRVIIEPDDNIMALYQAKRERYLRQQQRLKSQIGLSSETKNKQYIRLSADIGRLDDIERAQSNDAEGIGLFRSEFLFMTRHNSPDEAEQFEAYKRIVKAFPEKGAVIDTFSGGSGKGIQYIDIPKEKNPAMGFRGIRISLENPELLRTQLRAMYRASAFGKLSILLPMVSSVEEVEYVKRECEKVTAELRLKGVSFSEEVRLGVMIETPAAAIMSREICAIADFLTINTDNLIQFTLAMDKENMKLEDFYRPYHPAIKRLIKLVADNAHRCRKPVSVCGELASDTAMTDFFLALKINELAIIPSKILKVKATVRETDTVDYVRLLKDI